MVGKECVASSRIERTIYTMNIDVLSILLGISLRSKRKKDKLGRKGRRYASDDYVPRHEGVSVDEEVVYGSWTRSECFKIERGLLTFG